MVRPVCVAYAKISNRRNRTVAAPRHGVDHVVFTRRKSYELRFVPRPVAPMVIVQLSGKKALETCLGYMPVFDADSDADSDGALTRVPRWVLTIEVPKRRDGSYDRVFVNAWRTPTVRTLVQARKAMPRKGRCDFYVQLLWHFSS